MPLSTECPAKADYGTEPSSVWKWDPVRRLRTFGTLGVLILGTGMATYKLRSIQLFSPTVTHVYSVSATSGVSSFAHEGASTLAMDFRVAEPTSNRQSSIDRRYNPQVAKVLLFSLFWFPLIVGGAFGVWIRLRMASRQQALRAIATFAEEDGVDEELLEGDELKNMVKEAVKKSMAAEGTPEEEAELDNFLKKSRIDSIESVVTKAVSNSLAPGDAAAPVPNDDLLLQKLMDKDIQALLKEYVAKTTELNVLLSTPLPSDEAILELQAAEEEATRLMAEVKLREKEAQDAAARQSELRAQLESTEKMLEAFQGSGPTPDGRRTALLAVGGIGALQLLRTILDKTQSSSSADKQ